MKRSIYNCGIDIAKNKLDVYISPVKVYKVFENTRQGLQALIKWLKQYPLKRVVIEATGGYERLCLQTLIKAELPVSLVNPKRIRYFAKGLGILAKTDKLDAKLIALYAEKANPPLTILPSEYSQELKALVTYRSQLVKMRTHHRTILQTTVNLFVEKDLKNLIKTLNNKISKVEKKLKELVKKHPLSSLLLSAPGIGQVSLWSILAYLPELGHVNRQRIAALVGVAPYNDDSATRKGYRKIIGGREQIRRVLYMGVMVATQSKTKNNKIKQYYEHLINKGKKPKVAQTACLRKLVVILNTMVKNGEHWKEA